jgi:SAM-dependent methyltransferase
MKKKDVKKIVKKGYAEIAQQRRCCCQKSKEVQDTTHSIGYSDTDISSVPKESNLGLGCGNPIALSSLQPGEIVLDLGSGAGFDCFLAANKVGKTGRVIGVDMTSEMIEKARENALKGDYENVEFRLGEIEELYLEDNAVDVVISNCVINLSTDKQQVFNEAFRVLKPGGRLMVSDIVLLYPLPDSIRGSLSAYVGCIAGAVQKQEYLEYIKNAGFFNMNILGETWYSIVVSSDDSTSLVKIEKKMIASENQNDPEKTVVSILIQAEKPN